MWRNRASCPGDGRRRGPGSGGERLNDDPFDARTQLAVLAAESERLFSLDADIGGSIEAALAEAHDAADRMPEVEQATIARSHAAHERLVAKLRIVEAAARHVPACAGTGPLQAFSAPEASPVLSMNAQAPQGSAAP